MALHSPLQRTLLGCLTGPSAMVPRATRWQVWLMNPRQYFIFHPTRGLNPTGLVPLPSLSPGGGHSHLSTSTATTETAARGTQGPAFVCPRLPLPQSASLSLSPAITLASPPSPRLPFTRPPRFAPTSPPASALSPAHHILLQPINNFWAIAPGPCWARPLRRRSPAQPLSAPAASSKVQRGFHSPAPRQGVEEAAREERPRCQGAWHRKRGSPSPPRGTNGDGRAPAAPRPGDAESHAGMEAEARARRVNYPTAG